jgi:hypothetical protein
MAWIKEDIRHVGHTHDGQRIYSFRYKGDPSGTTHMGILAQEVEQHHPEAVGEVGGIKTADAAAKGDAGGAKPAAGAAASPARKTAVAPALGNPYSGRSATAGRKDPTHKALTQAHAALGLPPPPRIVAHDSLRKNPGK